MKEGCDTTAVQIRELEDGRLALVLPDALLTSLGWQVHDVVVVDRTENGITLSLLPEAARDQLVIGRKVIRKHAGVLRALAEGDRTLPGES